VQTVLYAVPNDRDVGIGHIQMRIDPKGNGKKLCAIRLIAVEEVPVIKIPVCA